MRKKRIPFFFKETLCDIKKSVGQVSGNQREI